MKLQNQMKFAIAMASLVTQAALACPTVFIDGESLFLDNQESLFGTHVSISDHTAQISMTSLTGLNSNTSSTVQVGEQASWYLHVTTLYQTEELLQQCPAIPSTVFAEVALFTYMRPTADREVVIGYKHSDGSLFTAERINAGKWAVNCTNNFVPSDYDARIAAEAGGEPLASSEFGIENNAICSGETMPFVFSGPWEGDTLTRDDVYCAVNLDDGCLEPGIHRQESRIEISLIESQPGNGARTPRSKALAFLTEQRVAISRGISQGTLRATVNRLQKRLRSQAATDIVESRSFGATTVTQLRSQVQALRTRPSAKLRRGLTRILRTLSNL